MADRPKKIFLLGSHRRAGVDCGDWFSDLPNLADYDVVIVSTAPLAAAVMELGEALDNVKPENKADVQKRIQRILSRQAAVAGRLAQLLRTNGMVVAILHPPVGWRCELGGSQGWVYSDRWLPLAIKSLAEAGNTLEGDGGPFAGYLSHVKNWTHVFRLEGLGRLENSLDSEQWEVFETRCVTHASDRQGNPIVLAAWAEGWRRGESWNPVSGRFHCLVPPTEIDDEAAVTLLLADLFDISITTPPPTWLSEIKAPGEEQAVTKLDVARADLRTAEATVQEAETQVDQEKLPLRILYEQHHVLQDTCEDVFRRIGIGTKESPVSDEFVLELRGRELLVEVTGVRKKGLPHRDLSQLYKDIGNYFAKFEKPIKGVMVANVWIDTPPNEREPPNKPPFPPNVIEFAEQQHIALLCTRELFNAYCLVREGQLTAEQFFDLLESTDGVIGPLPAAARVVDFGRPENYGAAD